MARYSEETLQKINFTIKYNYLLEEWDFELNKDLDPKNFSAGSSQKVWWRCKSCSYNWMTAIYNRTKKKGTGCPKCNGTIIRKEKSNSLLASHKQIVDESWDYEFNTINPNEVSSGSGKVVFWKCSNHTEPFEMEIRLRVRGYNCNYCRNTKLLKGYNDFASNYPEMLKFWSYDLNDELPGEITVAYRKKVWWKCLECKGVFDREPRRIISNRKNCPYCKGQKTLKGFNDLESSFPAIAKDWDFDNNEARPDEITYGSNKKINWKCHKCSYQWATTVRNRTGRGDGCYKCKDFHTSIPEKEFIEYMKTILNNKLSVSNDRKILKGKEIDLYIPSLKLGFEFNGVYHHSTKFKKNTNLHLDKWQLAQKAGIRLITIWEDDWKSNKKEIENFLSETIQQYDSNTEQSFVIKSNNHNSLTLKEESTKIENMFLFKIDGNKIFLNEQTYNRFTIKAFYNFVQIMKSKYSSKYLVAVSNHDIDNDFLFLNNGFSHIEEIEPDFMYFRSKVRIDKNSVDEKNNLPRVYDCGSSIYSLLL